MGRQRHESKQQIPDTKRQQELKKEQDAKIKKDTVSFFGRFIPGTGSKESEVGDKKSLQKQPSKEQLKSKPKVLESVKAKGTATGLKKEQKQQAIVPSEGTIKRKPKRPQVDEDLPDLGAADVAKAAVQIQAAYKGFKTRQMVKQHKEVLPDLNCAQVQYATVKIQSAYRGFKTRKELQKRDDSVSDSSDSSEPESQQRGQDSSDSSATESEDESKKPTRVHSVRRAQATKSQKEANRRRVPESSATESDAIESMPDTDADADEKMYMPRTRRQVADSSATESEVGEDMPDLDDSDVENATIKIQSAYRGFQARKKMVKTKPVIRKQKFEDIVHSAITIQRAYRRYKNKKEERKKTAKITQQKKLALKSKRPQRDILQKPTKHDGPRKTKKRNLAEVALAAVTIQRAYRRYKMKKAGNRKSANKSKLQTQGSSDRTIKKA